MTTLHIEASLYNEKYVVDHLLREDESPPSRHYGASPEDQLGQMPMAPTSTRLQGILLTMSVSEIVLIHPIEDPSRRLISLTIFRYLRTFLTYTKST